VVVKHSVTARSVTIAPREQHAAGAAAAVRAPRHIRANRPAARGPAPAHHPRPVAADHRQPLSLSFLATELRRFIPGAGHGSDATARDGVLLLLSSLAMAAFAIASFALLRRLKRFEEQPR
jgi:hypothetical protein